MAKVKSGNRVFFWLAVLGLLVATTPSENPSGDLGILVVSHFIALSIAAPHFLQIRANAVPVLVLIYLFFLSSIFAVSNLAAPSLWAFAVNILGMATMLLIAFSCRQGRLIAVIDVVLVINLYVLCIQGFVFFATGELLHPHQWLFPYSESRSGEFLGFLRMGGLHLEPGTYSNFLYLMVVFRILLGGRLTDLITILMFVSFALTFSAWGIIAFLTGLVALAISSFSNKRMMLRGIASIFVVLVAGFGVLFTTGLLDPTLEYIQVRFNPERGSASYRQETLGELIRTFDDYIPLGMPMQKRFCETCISPQDLGVWSQMIVRFGLLTAVFMIAVSLIAAWKHSPAMLLLVGFAFTGKYDLSKPITWMFLALVLLPLYSASPGLLDSRIRGGRPAG